MNISYLEHPDFINKIEQQGLIFRKKEKTGLRLPKAQELGQPFPTFVKHGDKIRRESVSVINRNIVIARNAEILGKDEEGADIYNEWLIPTETAIKNYGAEIVYGLNGNNFSYHHKKSHVTAIKITPEILKELGSLGDSLNIKVTWSVEPMVAKLGDFLTREGYSISAHDMQSYELVA